MRTLKLFALILVTVFGLNVAACCGPDKTEIQKTDIITHPTIGKQLEDLNNAYKSGAITQQEYERMKKEIVEKGDKK
jgi:hypothetical protein